MVAGMLMPLDNLRAIYERLFHDGVMVAKKDKRPQTKHPEIPGVGNLQVIRAMGSLKSKGFVRETFAWRHFYWYLTNEGIVYLRDYLHLPPEIVPTPLQRVRRPAATLSIVQRASRVQTVEGPTSYVPKPGMVGAESQEALKERQGYRHKRMQTEEESMPNENASRFRGRAINVDYNKSRSPGQSRDQAQSMYQGGEDHSFKKKITTTSHQSPAKISSETALVQKKSESYKRTSEASLIKNTTTMVNVDLPAQIALTAETDEVAASVFTSKEFKAKEEAHVKASPEPISTETAKDTYISGNFKEQVEQTLKVTKAKNTQEQKVKEKVTENMETSISTTSYTPQPGAVKHKTKASQETIISMTCNDAYHVSSSKGQMQKSLRMTEIKNIEEHPVRELILKNTETCQEPKTSKSPKDFSLSSHSKMLVEKSVKITGIQKTTKHPAEEKTLKNTETFDSMSSSASVPQPLEFKSVIKASQELISTIPANGATVPPSKKTAKVAETKNAHGYPIKDEILKNTETYISTTNEPVELKDKSKASQDLIISKPAKEISVPLSSTEQVEKTVKVTKTTNIQKHPTKNEMTKNTETSLSTSSTSTSQLVESKTKTTQELVTSEPPKCASVSPQSKKQEGKRVKVTKSKSSQEHLIKEEMPQNKETYISISASTVQELMPQTKVVTVLDESTKAKEIKVKDDTGISSGSAVPSVPESNECTTVVNDVVDFGTEKAEVCLVQKMLVEQTSNVDTESAVPPPTSNVQKHKKSQKTSSVKDTRLTPQESSTTDIKTESKMIEDGTNPVPEISDAATFEQVTEFIIHKELKGVEHTTTTVKKTTKQEITSVQQTPPPIKPVEESKAKDLEKEESEVAPKSSKRKKKKQHAADKQVSSSAAEISATQEMVTTQAAVKMHPKQGSEPFAGCKSPKICSEEGSQTAAVQSEAPVHKGEVELAQPSAEKIKREVLKGKTSSSHQVREAPTGQASAAAPAQAGPYPEHREPPSVAQHSASPATQCKREKKNVLSLSNVVKQPVTTGPLSAEEKQVLSEDEAAMRKKIVVVEEVIEVQQQIPTPSADGSQLPVPPVPEIPGEDLDYDVLEELAKDRTVFQSPVKEVVWDHSLLEPEPKTFPNFIEGMVKTESLLSCVCVMSLPLTGFLCVYSVGGSVWLA